MPRYKSAEMRQEKESVIQQAQAVHAEAAKEERSLTSDESAKVDQLLDKADGLTTEIRRMERLEGYAPEQQVAAENAEAREVAAAESEKREVRLVESDEYRSAFDSFVRLGGDAELRALQVGDNAEGGYTVPQTWANELIKSIEDEGVIRQLARVITTSTGEQINYPKVLTIGAAARINEEGSYAGTDPTFGTVALNAYKFGQMVKVSDELVRDSLFDIQAEIVALAGQAIGVAENKEFVVGDGSGDPNGITKAATVGKTASSATAVTQAELEALVHSLRPAYRRNASFIMNDATILAIRQLVTGISGDTTRVWQPGLQAGQPDRLLGAPVYGDPDVPTMSANNIAVVYGDINRGYRIRDVAGVGLKVLDQTYAENGQVGYRVDHYSDGDLVDLNAVKTLKMGS